MQRPDAGIRATGAYVIGSDGKPALLNDGSRRTDRRSRKRWNAILSACGGLLDLTGRSAVTRRSPDEGRGPAHGMSSTESERDSRVTRPFSGMRRAKRGK